MSEFVFELPKPPSVAVSGRTERFPVRRVLCVGRNYAAHAKEMGSSDREPPFFFFKPADAVVDDGSSIPYPPLTKNLHYEVELVVAIGKPGSNIDPSQSQDHIFGYAIGIDLTRRDLQNAAKEIGRPWDWGKGFDHSAPCGPLNTDFTHSGNARIWLDVNGIRKQEGNTSEFIWPIPEIVAQASQAMKLMPGDLIYTGTPAGVGPVIAGDRITAGIEGLGEITIDIALPQTS
jgi:fumarylpyruvate hydrolase